MAQVNKSDHNMHINGTSSALEVLQDCSLQLLPRMLNLLFLTKYCKCVKNTC